ncbi:glycosyltransferase family 4 protein [Cellulomonas sp. NPDC055163]
MTAPAHVDERAERASGPGPLRVVFVDHTSRAGGAELALARTLRHLPRGVGARVVVPSGPLGAFASTPALVVRRGPVQLPGAASSTASWARRARIGASAVSFVLALRRAPVVRSADVVCANTSRAAVLSAIALVGRPQPLVVHLRDAVGVDSLGRAGHAAMTRLVLPRAAAVVANSRFTLATAEPWLSPSAGRAVVASPTGISRRGARAARPAGLRRIGMVARLDPWKGHDLVLDAFAAAFAGEDAELHLAGGGDLADDGYAERLRARAEELGVDRQVRLRGHLDDVGAFVDSMDVCVQYSARPEPLGQNVLQYLARAVPAVVADEGGPAEWVVHGENGLRVPPRDPAALASALRALVGDPGLCERLSTGAAATELPDDRTTTATLVGELRRAARGLAGSWRRRA